ncbi:MAG: hypothetical protein KDD66_11395 [Bdellovibrionales bacterium]|nr:hypothetical protein [Bdellovibrionales bacterium]
MKKRCRQSGVEFEISPEEAQFYESLELPLPRLCPEERQRRRIAYRNFRTLCYRPCDATQKRILSMYSQDCPFPVYETNYWWSDAWSAFDYGRAIDFQRPFFEQYQALAAAVPRFPIMNLQSENCGYSNFVFRAKDCYLVFGCVDNDSCMYGHIVWESENCVDNLYVYRSQWCSNCVDCVECYDVHYSFESTGCTESYFLYDCRSCSNCFGCWNLRGAQYCLFNQQFSREEYKQSMQQMFPMTWEKIEYVSGLLEERRRAECVVPEHFGLKNEDVSGNHIYESKNLENCWDAKVLENCRHCYTVLNTNNSHDISFTAGPVQFCADVLTVTGCERVFYSHMLSNCSDSYLSEFCFNCRDVFGCIGLRNAQYCIFNKQYSKDDYFALRKRLIAHMEQTEEWGEFFPIKDSPFAYNESIVNEYYPLTKQEAQSLGWRWKERNVPSAVPAAESAPKTINEADSETCKRVFKCQKSGQAYKVIPQELDFYRRIGLPLPSYCPDVRHEQRMNLRSARRLEPRTCAKCKGAILTAHTETAETKLLCQDCYQNVLHASIDTPLRAND